jgi:hypothetical protein
MSWRKKPGRISALLSLGAGAALLLFVFANVTPATEAEPQRPDRPADLSKLPIPEELPVDPMAVAKISLPAPPSPKFSAPESAPEPTVKIEPLRPADPAEKAEPAPKLEPLRPTEPEVQAKPELEVSPIKPRKPEAKPAEPVAEIKPLKKTVREKPSVQPRKPEPKPETVVEPAPEYTVKPMEPRHTEPAPEPEMPPVAKPEPKAQSETVQVSVQTRGAVVREGRALLRLLEHGSGPTIEIAWPPGNGARRQLYRSLTQCYGMQAILIDGHGNLFRQSGERGRKWEINLDRFSGFVRQPAGFIAGEEQRLGEDIRRYHGLGYGTSLVRVFPRHVDAVLLGGLQKLLGGKYKTSGLIRATYRMSGEKLFIDGIETDGRPVEGRIVFSGRRGCRT